MSSEKLIVGPFNKGFQNYRTAFVIDNEAFPTLVNAYQWRGRVKRKRGTELLSRLNRNVISINLGTTATDGSFSGLITGYTNIVLGSVSIVVTGTPNQTFVDDSLGNLSNGAAGTGTIDYISGTVTFQTNPVLASAAVTAAFTYYPALPVMGLEDLHVIETDPFIGTIGFDTTYSYQFDTTDGSNHDVSYYKNPPVNASWTGYTPKTAWTPVTWTGHDYQQFSTCNYQGAFWAVNNTPGMHFQASSTATQSNATTVVFTITSPQMVVGDFVFANEFTATSTPADANTLNGQTGYVTVVAGNSVTVVFPNASIASDTYTTGILQLLTNSVTGTGNGIRWYDGDPTIGGALPPTQGFGWVNFAPPLSSVQYAIDQNPIAQYYLCGAKMVIPFKGRLLFLSPWITTSKGAPLQLQDTIICSQDGTAFYTGTCAGSIIATPPLPFNPVLVPADQSGTPKAYWMDIPGFGYYITAGVQQPIVTANPEKDVLIVGFTSKFAQFTYTGNDLLPFAFYSINAEWGAGSTFSGITMDRGALTIGNYGITFTGIDASTRVDLEIPDQIFQINNANNGADRVCSQRDYINEWIFFTYPSSLTFNGGDDPEQIYNFPTQTLFYNYRDQSWALFNESYTTYGAYRQSTGYTWANLPYSTWDEPPNDWPDESWDESALSVEAPQVAAGNQQGFVMLRTQGTSEGTSLFISSISSTWEITAPNHCLFTGDYIVIDGCLGGPNVSAINGGIYSVVVIDSNTFTIDPSPTTTFDSYIGGGLITRMYVPLIQTKQFPTAWGTSRKTRIGTQQYLFTNNSLGGQVTAYIFLSQQNTGYPYNYGPIVPSPLTLNNALIYSSIVYTCPEPSYGLETYNLQTPTAPYQAQIWHRQNTSLIGDTIQVGFTLSDEQMRDTTSEFPNQFGEIELHSFIFDIYPSQILA